MSIGDQVASAVSALLAGHLVAFPTETVYGLGADATNEVAVSRIFRTKGRPTNHPLIVHLAGIDAVDMWARDLPEYAWALANAFWPGPMTLVVNKRAGVSSLVTGGQDTVGLRVPSHPVAVELLDEFARRGGQGVAAPSANRFGQVSPTSADDVRSELGEYLLPGDLIVEGGNSHVGVESSIIDCTGIAPAIARPGAITREMVEAATGVELMEFDQRIRVSGSHSRHYSPRAEVVLDDAVEQGDGLIALSEFPTPPGAIRLLEAPSVEAYASGVYSALRRADQLGLGRVVAMTPPGEGLAVAVRDRLVRASHRRAGPVEP